MATLPSFVLDYSKILACVHGQRRRSGAACARHGSPRTRVQRPLSTSPANNNYIADKRRLDLNKKATANRPTPYAMSQHANELPKFDGQVAQLSTWLRALRQAEHHLPDDVAFFVRTGAKVNSNGTLSVTSDPP